VYDDIALMAGNERKHEWFKFTANGANPGKIIATMQVRILFLSL